MSGPLGDHVRLMKPNEIQRFMLKTTKDRLSAADRQKHETILALDETLESLRKRRMWASFQIFGLIFTGLAISVLTYNLAIGGPGQLMSVLPQTVGTAALCLVVLSLLSGRGATRDFAKLQELKQEAARAMASDTAETVTLDLDDTSFVVRHSEGLWLVTAHDKGAAIVDLTADSALEALFRQASPPLRHISWLQAPKSGEISHVIQGGLPPSSLDRVDMPDHVSRSELKEALDTPGNSSTTLSKRSTAELRTAMTALMSE